MEEREHDEEGPPFAVASDWVRKQAARCTLHVRCTLAVPSFFQLFIIFLFSYFFGSSSNRCTSLDAYCTVVVQPRQRSTVHLFHSPELHTSLPGLPYPYSTVSVWPSESPPHAKKKHLHCNQSKACPATACHSRAQVPSILRTAAAAAAITTPKLYSYSPNLLSTYSSSLARTSY